MIDADAYAILAAVRGCAGVVVVARGVVGNRCSLTLTRLRIAHVFLAGSRIERTDDIYTQTSSVSRSTGITRCAVAAICTCTTEARQITCAECDISICVRVQLNMSDAGIQWRLEEWWLNVDGIIFGTSIDATKICSNLVTKASGIFNVHLQICLLALVLDGSRAVYERVHAVVLRLASSIAISPVIFCGLLIWIIIVIKIISCTVACLILILDFTFLVGISSKRKATELLCCWRSGIPHVACSDSSDRRRHTNNAYVSNCPA